MGIVLNESNMLKKYLDWACGIEWADIPDVVRHRIIMVLADNIAATCSAANEPEVIRFREQTLAQGESGCASVFAPGRARLAARDAAMNNGLAMGWNELDEGYRKAVCHAGLYVLPALLATAEVTQAPLHEVLRAAVLGYDTVARIARSWQFPRMDLHPHALLAPVGAAAGVAHLLRLPVSETLLAVAGATSMGMTGAFNQATKGILTRNAWAAQGAVSGLNAVALARCGIGGTAATPNDVYTALGARADASQLDPVASPGWAVLDGYHKMNACCQYAHSSIEAVQTLISEHPELQGGKDIASITIEIHPLGFGLNDRAPVTTLGAKFSIPHAVAAAFVHGHGAVTAFNTVALNDPRIAVLRDKVVLQPFPEQKPAPHDRPSRVSVITTARASYSALCWSARGGPDRPYTEDMIWEKIGSLSALVAPGLQAAIRQLDDCAQSAGAAALKQRSATLAQPWGNFVDTFFTEARD